jgi:hypothetical protein
LLLRIGHEAKDKDDGQAQDNEEMKTPGQDDDFAKINNQEHASEKMSRIPIKRIVIIN